jgi:hypothetical protein
MTSELHWGNADRVGTDPALGIDCDPDARELSPGLHGGALSPDDEAVQLANVVPVQREPRLARCLLVWRDQS